MTCYRQTNTASWTKHLEHQTQAQPESNDRSMVKHGSSSSIDAVSLSRGKLDVIVDWYD